MERTPGGGERAGAARRSALRVCAKTNFGQEAQFKQNAPHPSDEIVGNGDETTNVARIIANEPRLLHILDTSCYAYLSSSSELLRYNHSGCTNILCGGNNIQCSGAISELAARDNLHAQLRPMRTVNCESQLHFAVQSVDSADGVDTVDVVDAFRPAMSCLHNNAAVLPALVRCGSKKSRQHRHAAAVRTSSVS